LCFEEDVVEDEDDFVRSGFCEDRLDGLGEQAAIVLLSAVTITKVTVNVIIGFKFNTNGRLFIGGRGGGLSSPAKVSHMYHLALLLVRWVLLDCVSNILKRYESNKVVFKQTKITQRHQVFISCR